MPAGREVRQELTGAGRFFSKPVRQLRDFGASTPSALVKRNVSPSVLTSRQPVIVTSAGMTLAVESDSGAGGGSDAAGFGSESSFLGASAIAAATATGAGDFPEVAARFVTACTDDFLGGSLAARGVIAAGGATGTALGAGGSAIG